MQAQVQYLVKKKKKKKKGVGAEVDVLEIMKNE